jgi:thiamine-monophosphate kinase
MDEFGFIASLLAPLAAREKGALGLEDDAAILSVPPGQALVITKDALAEGVHFIGDEPPALIARKLLGVNLSDLAAMGAKPWGYFLALMLPADITEMWLRDFAQGLEVAQRDYGMALMGGDTTRTLGPLALSATALGLVPHGTALLRSGAGAGDEVYVSGTLGDSALGLRVAGCRLQVKDSARNLQPAACNFLLERYRLPQPRLALGEGLRGIASACMDISDGLMQDLGHICAASGVGAEMRYPDIPLSKEARLLLARMDNPHEIVLAGGDDYELLFTVPSARAKQLRALADASGTPVTRIGRITDGRDVKALDGEGREIVLARRGYRHF